jgi:hypothetical protein
MDRTAGLALDALSRMDCAPLTRASGDEERAVRGHWIDQGASVD